MVSFFDRTIASVDSTGTFAEVEEDGFPDGFLGDVKNRRWNCLLILTEAVGLLRKRSMEGTLEK